MLPSAHDQDSLAYSVQYYLIRSSQPLPFRLEKRFSGVTKGLAEVRMVVVEKLDRELVDRYEFQVVAVDGDGGFTPLHNPLHSPPHNSPHNPLHNLPHNLPHNPPPNSFDNHHGHNKRLSDSLNVSVAVVDVNDNKPLFDRSIYEVWLHEDTLVGSLLQQLHATDEDAGDNGKITYTLDLNSRQEYSHVVEVVAATGEVFLKEPLDYEAGVDKMVITVVASDSGSSPLQSTAVLVVHLIDVNDNHPNISVNTLTSHQRASVVENAHVSSRLHFLCLKQNVSVSGFCMYYFSVSSLCIFNFLYTVFVFVTF